MSRATLAFLTLIALSGHAHAETELEKCADTTSKQVLELVKKTGRLQSEGQLDSVVTLVKIKCSARENDQELQTVRNSVQKNAKEILGDSFFAPLKWSERALANVNEQLKGMFGADALTGAQFNLIPDEANQQLSGTATLSNGQRCAITSGYKGNQSSVSISCR